jgi:hypothetical protein
MEIDNKDENHVDDQEYDITNNSKTSERGRGVSMGLHIIIRSPV